MRQSIVTGLTNDESANWSALYGERHRLERITHFPTGMDPPRKVRVYRRQNHYVLQAWDPAQKRTISDRVDGDLLAALIRAREIDERILNFRRAGTGHSRLGHEELVKRFVAALDLRANAGEIDPRTVRRYEDALAHYTRFCQQASVHNRFPLAHRVDHEFQLTLAAYLTNLRVAPNGRAGATKVPMRGHALVLDTVRAMYLWAADPLRGNLLPSGFINPFGGRRRSSREEALDPTRELAITKDMAEAFLLSCDSYQLSLFGPMVLFGLRASEPIFLFHEHCSDGFLTVGCLPEIDYWTKGRRSKRLPLLERLNGLWGHLCGSDATGFLYRQRHFPSDMQRLDSLKELTAEFQERCRIEKADTARHRRDVRDDVVRDAGCLSYDIIQGEFSQIAKRLKWPKSATLKGFRHLFATVLEDGGMPEHYRKYFMGQSHGRAAVVTYTHLVQLRKQFESVMNREWPSLLEVIEQASNTLHQARVPA